MVRLIIALAIAALIGYGLGTAMFTAGYSGVDERFADLSIYEPVPLGGAAASSAKGETTENSRNVPPIVDIGAGKIPKVQIAGGTTHDFGTMQQGSKKTHTFMFKNIGTAPMNLEMGPTSCRCTIGSLKDSGLQPGEETGVTLEWKATGVLDQFSQTATIITNDPDHRNVLLTVRGIVARTILIEPPTLTLGDVPVGEGAKRTAYVFGYGDVPMEVKKVTWGDERTANMVDIEVSPMEIDLAKFPHHERANGAAKIEMTIKNGMMLGPINSRLVVDTNIENVTNVDLAVTGTVVGEIQFLPSPKFEAERSLLEFDRVPHGAGAMQKMFLSVQGKYRDTLTVEVQEVVPAESLQVTVGEPTRQQNRTIYPITCTVPKDAPAAMFPGTSSKNFGKVILKTNHPDIPQVKLNLRLVVE